MPMLSEELDKWRKAQAKEHKDPTGDSIDALIAKVNSSRRSEHSFLMGMYRADEVSRMIGRVEALNALIDGTWTGNHIGSHRDAILKMIKSKIIPKEAKPKRGRGRPKKGT